MTHTNDVEKRLKEIEDKWSGPNSSVVTDFDFIWIVARLRESLKREAELVAALEKIGNKETCNELYPGNNKYKSYEDGWEGVSEYARRELDRHRASIGKRET